MSGEESISVVIPLMNEEPNLFPLFSKLRSVLNRLGMPWEVIFVDDGSTDNSPTILERICLENENVCVIQLRRNFGKSAALSAGFALAKGTIIVTMDADLQDDPSEIPRMLEKIRKGYDLVSGWKFIRRDLIYPQFYHPLSRAQRR